MKNMTDMQRQYLQMLKEEEKEELSKNLNLITSFKELALKRGVKLIDENFSYIRTIGIVAAIPILLSICVKMLRGIKKDYIISLNFVVIMNEKQ